MKTKPASLAVSRYEYEHTGFPDLLDDGQRRQIALFFSQSAILPVSSVFWRKRGQEVIPRLRFTDSLLYAPVRGSIVCQVNGEPVTVGPGRFLMIPDGVEIEGRMAEGCTYHENFSIHFIAHAAGGKSLFSLFSSVVGVLDNPSFWFGQFRLLTHLLGADPELGRRFGQPLIANLLTQQILAGVSLREIPQADDGRPWNAVTRMLREFPNLPTVRELARKEGLSEVRFRKLFHAQMGKSPKAFMRDLRLNRAQALLQTDPHLTIKEIAERTG
ncbi:MAG: helix-turn-helix transcriptional regulator, partial [Lentisphaerae bacterium]|nr:helix-turn-helix transcriptional regulator [Lentisphaerota bacterium]